MRKSLEVADWLTSIIFLQKDLNFKMLLGGGLE